MNIQLDDDLDADSPWSSTKIGFCKIHYRELPNSADPKHPFFDSKIECEFVGDNAPTASPRARLAYFMSTQCPADKYLRRSTDDQAIAWIRMRNDYIAIASCFHAWE